MKRKQLITSDEAVQSFSQHVKPCSDCPWSRQALNGWLGGASIDQWRAAAHSDTYIECHVMPDWQCAGVAIYRANVCKKVRVIGNLELPTDRQAVFATPLEFEEHHSRLPGFKSTESAGDL